MDITLRLIYEPPECRGNERKRTAHTIEIEDETNQKKEVRVVFTARTEVRDGIGEVREERNERGQDETILYISRTVPPYIVPIIAQALYFESKGHDRDVVKTAAVLYGQKVLTGEDLGRLVMLLGIDSSQSLAATSGSAGGNPDYYLATISRYLGNYEKCGWVARQRAMAGIGIKTQADVGRGVIVAKAILDEGAWYCTGEDGKKKMVAPALRDVLPEVVGHLEAIMKMIDEKKSVSLIITDPLVLRVLYLFTEDFIDNSPIVFHDKGKGKAADGEPVEFRPDSARFIRSALNHLRIDLKNEHNATQLVLESAQNKFGQLTCGVGFVALIGEATRLTVQERKKVTDEMLTLSRRGRYLKESLLGRRLPQSPQKQPA